MYETITTERAAPSARKYFYAAALLAAFIALLVHLPSLAGGFVNWDDQIYVYENQQIKSLDIGFLRWVLFAEVATNWHPLTILSYAFDYAVWGLNPVGYHLTNVILHAACTLLVFVLAARLAGESRSSLFAALVTALLFALHPLHVESVAWVSERKDVLFALFFLLSTIAYLKYVSTKAPAHYVAALVLFALSLMSKPMAVTLPLVLLILDFHPLRRLDTKRAARAAAIEKLPFFALSAFSSIMTLWAQAAGQTISSIDVHPMATRVYVAVQAYAFYLYKTVLPTDLAPFYPLPEATPLLGIGFLSSLLLLVAITVFCTVLVRRERVYLAVWLFYLVTLLPVIGLVQVGTQAAADRYTYLPLLGPFFLIGLGVGAFTKKVSSKGRVIGATSAVVLVLALLTVVTVGQMAVWRDSITLWTRQIELYPGSSVGYNNRGLAYAALGETLLAIEDFSAATQADQLDPNPYINRGASYGTLGDFQSAIRDYNTAILIDPGSAPAYFNRAGAYGELGDRASAIGDFTRAIELDPGFADAFNNRAIARAGLGDFATAEGDFSMAIFLEPRNAMFYNNRGKAHFITGDIARAIGDFSTAVRLDRGHALAYYNLALVYSRTGDEAGAVENFKRAADLGMEEARQRLKVY